MEISYLWWIGLFQACVLAPLLLLKPRWFLWSHRAKFWINLLGEPRTVLLVRFVSAPLALAAGCALMYLGR